MAGPLDGITVIDISAVISGPFCCQVLADQGAEVIKVEPKGIGDVTRLGGFKVGDVSAMFATANRGKQSIALDLSQPAGVEVLHDLAAVADVLVQNFRPGAVDRMGIGPAALHARNPDLIYVSISGFGPSGPYADWRVYDPVIQAVSGVVSIQESPDIPFPDLIRTLVCDKSTALTAAQAISAALFARERGQASGQHLEIPMLDSTLYWLWPDTFMGHTFTGPDVIPGPLLYQIYRLQNTADGNLVYIAITDSEWEGLVQALGHPQWWEEPRFNDVTQRVRPENFEAIGGLLDEAFRSFATDDIMARLLEHQVPAARVNALEDVFTDPQVTHNACLHEWEHPTAGKTTMAKPPVRWSHTTHETVWSVDRLGESTDDVLRRHGFDDARLAALRNAGVI